ncbi:alkaline phosphatase PhoX [Luteipulveratus mongoliensis]|uniref:Tat pathway signal sequence domain protein n=1 Tax=Luteipulveratus mongoliensis TaxID=571913 RepID=A0A0K1JNP9_9MICO|nr:alkaline phosphatase PhoX [Luteipulveratus mongoliensis]AKU18349.1 Tat pathway signal sequence domain protein [Luteipulveratus mongoliensis]
MSLSRRTFLVTTGATGLSLALTGRAEALHSVQAGPSTGYGPLVPDPAGVLDLPKGFRYQVLSREGDRLLSGQGVVPGSHDGMGSFDARRGAKHSRTHLVRNHENYPDAVHTVPTDGLRTTYDPGAGGGTTNLVLDASLRPREEYVSLGGTAINCSGGHTPWHTWLTCEETEGRAGTNGYTKDHGWIFEVDPFDNRRNADPVPLKDMGRFMHEAVAVDPRKGVVYETEDAFSGAPLGSFYRFLPERPCGGHGSLRAGGTLQAMHAPGLSDMSLVREPGTTFKGVEWFDVPDPTAATTPVRAQDYAKPIVRGQKLEGCWWGDVDGCVYFVSSFARPKDGSAATHDGQVWKYDPRRRELTLEIIFNGTDADDTYECPDNICMSPYGGLMMCEDSSGENYLLGTTRDGEPFTFARNRQELSPGETGELSGVSFSADGKTLFFNVYTPGTTFAVTGPWRRHG